MPQVRTYERQIEPRPLPGVRRQQYRIAQLETPPTPVAPQSGVAGFGKTLGTVAENLYAIEKEKDDQVRTLAAKNQVGQALNQILYDPNQGALNVHGEPSFGLMQTVGEQFKQVSSKAREGLANDRQRLEFDAYVDSLNQETYRTVAQHIERERYSVDGQHVKAFTQNRTEAALNDPDPRQAELAASDIQNEYEKHGARWGWDPEVTKQAVSQARSDLFVGMIQKFQDRNQPQDDIRAQVYYEEHKQDILPSVRPKIEASLQKSTTLGQAQRIGDVIMAQYSEDKTQTEMEDMVPKYTSDPETRQKAEELIGRRFQQMRQDTNYRETQAAKEAKAKTDALELQIKNNLDAAAQSGLLAKTYDQIVPESIRKQLPQSVEESGRKYWDLISKGKEPETDIGLWRKLRLEAANDPNKFITESIDAFQHKLSKSDYKELTGLQADIIKGNRGEANKTIEGIITHERIINSSLRQIGIDPDAKENKATADALWSAVGKRVDILQSNSGKKASEQDIQGIVDDELQEMTFGSSTTPLYIPGVGSFNMHWGNQTTFRKFQLPTNEPTARNPKTGEVLVLRNGQWVKP